jgi:hypothetical protein
MLMLRRRVLVLLALALATAGCAKPEPVAEVSGDVIVDEKPLAEGEIYFLTPGRPPEILAIKDGRFAGKARLGQRRVEIYAYRRAELPSTATVVTEAPKENYISARYNSDSDLQAEVKQTGPNRFEYQLVTPTP